MYETSINTKVRQHKNNKTRKLLMTGFVNVVLTLEH